MQLHYISKLLIGELLSIKNHHCLSDNYKFLHLIVERVIERCHLPTLKEMSKPQPTSDVWNYLEDTIRCKRIAIGMISKISRDALNEYIVLRLKIVPSLCLFFFKGLFLIYFSF